MTRDYLRWKIEQKRKQLSEISVEALLDYKIRAHLASHITTIETLEADEISLLNQDKDK